jgi:hypothetical protein
MISPFVAYLRRVYREAEVGGARESNANAKGVVPTGETLGGLLLFRKTSIRKTTDARLGFDH